MPHAELSDRLHHLADAPIDVEAAYQQVLRRHRQRRLRRWAGVGALAIVVLVSAALAVPERGGGRVDVVDDTARVEPRPSPRPPLLLYGDDGVSLRTGSRAIQVWSDPVSSALSDRLRGIVLQDRGGGPIRWLADVQDPRGATVVTTAGARLVAVVERGREPTVLFTRRVGGGEGQIETLFAHSLPSATTRRVFDTGALESGLDAAAAFADGRLALSTCHLQCTVWAEDEYEKAAGGTGEPLVHADWIAGLDIAGDTLAYVRYQFDPEKGTVTDPALVIADVAGPVRVQVPLPAHTPSSAARVDLDAGGGSAIVTFVAASGTEFASALVRDLTGPSPSVEQLGATGASFAGSTAA